MQNIREAVKDLTGVFNGKAREAQKGEALTRPGERPSAELSAAVAALREVQRGKMAAALEAKQ